MTDTSSSPETRPSDQPARRRARELAVAGLLTALALILGVNGTLASWTTAVVTNTQNSAVAANAVALTERTLDNQVTCSTLTSAENSTTCSTINKYGGGQLSPGGPSQSTGIELINSGTASGVLTIQGGACTTSGATEELCDYVQVYLDCSHRLLLITGIPLSTFATNPPVSVMSPMAPGEIASCAIRVSLASNTPAALSGQTFTQVIIWRLTQL